MSGWHQISYAVQNGSMYAIAVWFAWRGLEPRAGSRAATALFAAAQAALTALFLFAGQAWADTVGAWALAAYFTLGFERKRHLGYLAYWIYTGLFALGGALATFFRVMLMPGAQGATFFATSPRELLFVVCAFLGVWALAALAARLLKGHPGWRKVPAWVCWGLLALDAAGFAAGFLSEPATRPALGVSIAVGLAAAAAYVLWSQWRIRRLRSQQEQLLAQQLLQGEYLQTVRENRSRLRVLRHDLANHVQTAALLLDQGREDQARAYLQQLARDIRATGRADVCENLLVNTVVCNKQDEAARRGVRLEMQLQIPASLSLPGIDVVSLFGNLLDNALHACRAGDTVALEGAARQGLLTVEVRNPLHGRALPRRILPPADEAARHGYGLWAVQALARRHGGSFTLRRREEDDQAVALVTLYLDGPAGGEEGREELKGEGKEERPCV